MIDETNEIEKVEEILIPRRKLKKLRQKPAAKSLLRYKRKKW